jgi:peptidoglycan/xylan/chitin deacetylase (PgdA/CDA1 family)
LYSKRVAPIWRKPPHGFAEAAIACLDSNRNNGKSEGTPMIFFRADDIGVPGSRFTRLLQCFRRHRVPLCLAVVPAWLTVRRWESLRKSAGADANLWCWHQHGWRHANHEPSGKKGEFGGRRRSDIASDITRGRQRLETIMGNHFYPAFTPPWNRCSTSTLDVLRQSGFLAVSRTPNCLPAAPAGLPDLAVSVDLHTRKESDPRHGQRALLEEMRQSLARGLCGIMIHHQRMNDAAFDFLDALLSAVSRRSWLPAVSFREMVANQSRLI